MPRIALGIEYDGSRYYGWQTQLNKVTIQAQVEKALARVATHPVSIFCAGRTDKGVHASGQVIHFDSLVARSELAWVRGTNTYLPKDIRVCWAKEVGSAFDARRSALARCYCYLIVNRSYPFAIMHQGAMWVPMQLDVSAMQKGAAYLLGKHDFSAFRGAGCQAKTPLRTVESITVRHHQHHILIEIRANAFLYHMVRNIVGTLVLVGQHHYAPAWVEQVLLSKNRSCSGFNAPASGLYLVEVIYPDSFLLPKEASKPWFLHQFVR